MLRALLAARPHLNLFLKMFHKCWPRLTHRQTILKEALEGVRRCSISTSSLQNSREYAVIRSTSFPGGVNLVAKTRRCDLPRLLPFTIDLVSVKCSEIYQNLKLRSNQSDAVLGVKSLIEPTISLAHSSEDPNDAALRGPSLSMTAGGSFSTVFELSPMELLDAQNS